MIYNYEDGYFTVQCPACGNKLNIADLIIINDAVLCVFCNNFLGYIWDIPEKELKQ